MSTLEVHGIANGLFDENSWLLWDSDSRRAVVVDPGEEYDRILAAIAQRRLEIEAVWLTHAHLDHIWGVDAIRGAHQVPVLLHPLDQEWYDRAGEQAIYYGITTFPDLAPPDGELRHGQRLRFGDWSFDVRHVPGHAPGHVAFVGNGVCVTGDVLMLDSVGRTDLPGCDPAALDRSIATELLTLPDETRVLPGHGPETTIGRERRLNPFLQG